MKGRDTASPETRVAAEYLAAHLFAAGAEPLGDHDGHGRTFFQSFPLEVVTPLEAGTELELILEFNGSKRVIPCKLGSEFILRPLRPRPRARSRLRSSSPASAVSMPSKRSMITPG